MHKLGSTLCLVLTASWLAACSDSPRTTGTGGGGGGGTGQKDAGSSNPLDGGATGQDAAAIQLDAHTAPPACDPIANNECTTAGEACFLVTGATNEGQCRPIQMPTVAHTGECSTATHNCEPGFACVQFDAAQPARCFKVCHTGQDPECMSVQTGTVAWGCMIPLQGGQYGLCAPKPAACQAWADTCPPGQYCEAVTPATTGCIPVGPNARGAACGGATGACQRGNVCVNSTCQEPCDRTPGGQPCSTAGDTCVGWVDSATMQPLPFGTCAPGCSVLDDMCPMAERCNGSTCVPEGAANTGDQCQYTRDCRRGDICITTVAGQPGNCRTACDATHPCAAGTCQPLGTVPYGACI